MIDKLPDSNDPMGLIKDMMTELAREALTNMRGVIEEGSDHAIINEEGRRLYDKIKHIKGDGSDDDELMELFIADALVVQYNVPKDEVPSELDEKFNKYFELSTKPD